MDVENDITLLPDSRSLDWQKGIGGSLDTLDVEEGVRAIPEPHQIAIVFGVLVVLISIFLRKMRYR